jgi:hypothetical protein
MGRASRAEDARGGPLGRLLGAAGRLLQRLVPRGRAWIPVGLWMALISALSELPGHPGGTSVSWVYLTNLGHAPLFGLLGLWMALLLPRQAGAPRGGTWPRIDRAGTAQVLAGVAAFGLVDELHQRATGRRDFSLLDLLTDVTAAACVLWVAAHAGRPASRDGGLAGRLAVSAGLCLAAAALATWLPGFFPGVEWM